MPNGTVKFFNVNKGFGFITSDEGGKEVFVPAASLASSGLTNLKTGQRVCFESKPDTKGPKAVNVTLLPDVIARNDNENSHRTPMDGGKARLTLYHDPANEASRTALQELCDAGYEPRVVEYLVTPPNKDELKRLSLLFRGSDQSLVKKYAPLFLELSLDDRFISESEFWQAIFEHPSLINGPILASAAKASFCGSKNAVKAFLAAASTNPPQPIPKQKALPASILQMMGDTVKPVGRMKETKHAELRLPKKSKNAHEVSVMTKVAPKPKPKKTTSKTVTEPKSRTKSTTKPKGKPKPRAKSTGRAKVKGSATRGPKKTGARR
jgi:arsenate reductase